jgi:hypothetical protein
MRRLLRAGLLGWVGMAGPWERAGAQQVPGRDLLHFPLGTMDRPSALGRGIGDGMANPAAVSLDSASRVTAGVSALQTPSEQGVAGQLVAAALALPGRITVGLAAARFAVDDIFRTDTDPQTVGGRVAYGTTVYSATVARRHGPYLAAGLAVRYRRGEMDTESRGAVGLDAGLLAEGLPYRDASVGVASFMWRPANAELERSALNVAADLRLAGGSEPRQLRIGYGLTLTEGRQREELGMLTGHLGAWDVRAGLARHTQYGLDDWRARFGVGLRYDRYRVSVAREANGAGLDAMYQFSLSATLR